MNPVRSWERATSVLNTLRVNPVTDPALSTSAHPSPGPAVWHSQATLLCRCTASLDPLISCLLRARSALYVAVLRSRLQSSACDDNSWLTCGIMKALQLFARGTRHLSGFANGSVRLQHSTADQNGASSGPLQGIKVSAVPPFQANACVRPYTSPCNVCLRSASSKLLQEARHAGPGCWAGRCRQLLRSPAGLLWGRRHQGALL